MVRSSNQIFPCASFIGWILVEAGALSFTIVGEPAAIWPYMLIQSGMLYGETLATYS
jgi:hypothetical protein